jgi:hypothetical protein
LFAHNKAKLYDFLLAFGNLKINAAAAVAAAMAVEAGKARVFKY